MLTSCSYCHRIHDKSYICNAKRKARALMSQRFKKNSEENKLRNTNKWHNKSEQIRKDSRYLCSVCEDEGIYNYRDLEVHHITPLREDKSKLLDDSNLICLCRKHHELAEAGMIDREYLLKLAKQRINKLNKD